MMASNSSRPLASKDAYGPQSFLEQYTLCRGSYVQCASMLTFRRRGKFDERERKGSIHYSLLEHIAHELRSVFILQWIGFINGIAIIVSNAFVGAVERTALELPKSSLPLACCIASHLAICSSDSISTPPDALLPARTLPASCITIMQSRS